MAGADMEVLSALLDWQRGGRRAVLLTVVKTWGSSPRPPGSLLAIRDDGVLCGSVSGGCVEEDLIGRLRGGWPVRPGKLTYGGSPDACARFRLPCGGTLELVMEPAPGAEILSLIIDAIDGRRRIARRLHLPSGKSTLIGASESETVAFDGDTLETIHGPIWRLLLIGAGQVSRYLAEMAGMLDYGIFVCDPREEYRASWPERLGEPVSDMPDDAVRELRPDDRTAVVALTHDPKLDDLALLEALESPAFYVGAIGSQTNNARRRERLRLFDLSEAEILRLRGPVGLAIGSRTPPEIAVSILAELTAIRHGREFIPVENLPSAASLEKRPALPVS
jgi:xanthine dehydrogenase accessory factor